MTPAFEELRDCLKGLPGFGYRSAERVAIHLLLERPELAKNVSCLIENALKQIRPCSECGNISESGVCEICDDKTRSHSIICVVEQVGDLFSIEKSGSFRGLYHVLGGKLSPLKGVGPEDLNLSSLENRIQKGETQELILAMGNDIEGDATCHYIQSNILKNREVQLSRIAFGLPSGSGINIADAQTLQSAIEGRRGF